MECQWLESLAPYTSSQALQEPKIPLHLDDATMKGREKYLPMASQQAPQYFAIVVHICEIQQAHSDQIWHLQLELQREK